MLRLRCGEFEIDEARFELRRAGEAIAVQPKVLDLIVFLARHRTRVVTKDELFATVWKGTIVTEASLSQAVSLARRALGDDPATQHTIRTVRSKGFQFVGACGALPEAPPDRQAEIPSVAPAARSARASTMMETAQEEAPLASTPVRAPHLFAVIHCEAPELGGASWSLAEIDEVRLVRGSTRRTEREMGPLTQALTITLPGRLLSRQHARLTRTPSGWVIVDEESRNGTFVNGERITKHALSVGDVIECGRTLLCFADAWVHPSRAADVDPPSIVPTVTPSLEALARDLERIASLALPVLVVGEGGTGKTFTAHALHARSERSGAVVTVDAATVAAETSLLEVAVAQARGGTLVIDNLQRAEASGLSRLTGVIERAEAVRFVATLGGTSDDLDRVPAELLGRISGFLCELPPLRERLGDLGVLAATLSRAFGLHLPELDPSVARALLAHRWPGNLRELTQALEVCVALSRGSTVRLQHLPPELRTAPS